MPIRETVAVTIANGTALSPEVTVNGDIVGVQMPAAWTAAGITFQALVTPEATFGNVYTDAHTEVSLTSPAAGEYIAVAAGKLVGLGRVKVRSGTSGTPVNQGAARVLYLVVQR